MLLSVERCGADGCDVLTWAPGQIICAKYSRWSQWPPQRFLLLDNVRYRQANFEIPSALAVRFRQDGRLVRNLPAARKNLLLESRVEAFHDHQIDGCGVLPQLAYLLILFRMISC